MDKITAPNSFDFELPKLSTIWQQWKDEFKLYAENAMKGNGQGENVSQSLYLMGRTGRENYDTLKPATATDAVDNSQTIENCSKPYSEIQNETVERYKFFTGDQETEERRKQGMKIEEVFSKSEDVFKGEGQIPGIIHLTTDPSVPPIVAPPQRVPVAMKPKLQTELARLEGMNITEKAVEPSDWVSNLVIIMKTNGHTLTANGLKADPHQIDVIAKMPEPNVPGVQRLGMVKYPSKFLPSLSDKCEPLNRLTYKDVVQDW
ncbi:hypothetical protein HOLleu_05023 [Holothuria leucospilota]|uniref:Reverse transcriptase domain-containing protein n=1 Tax=Holothuria leucospilota TaxID=206669 RepID=A0A9Q1CKE4_HOLLE|nr:hypothetical protein HOLleu_05023 [Holothuria leucospilota]